MTTVIKSIATTLAESATQKVNLRNIMGDFKGTTFAGLTIETDHAVYAKVDGEKNPHYKRIVRRTTSQVEMYDEEKVTAYQDKINKQLMREGKETTFESGKGSRPAPNYETLEGCVQQLVSKSTGDVNHYLRYLPKADTKPTYEYFFVEDDGTKTPIAYEDIKGKKPAPKVKSDSQGGVEKKVDIRIVKLQNIVGMRVKGQNLSGAFYYE